MSINIEYVEPERLSVPEWRATYTLRPEMLIISASLSQFGFIEPIHARLATGEIIDGSERFLLATNVPQILRKSSGKIPVVFHDVDAIDAMMMHLRLNRGHSTVIAPRTSEIIRLVKRSGKYGASDFEDMLCMRAEELSLMLDGSLFKVRKIKEHNYARAWVPIEAPPGSVEPESFSIERPPNPDR
jgi:hypothetical protein